MHRCIHAPIHCRMRDATVLDGLAGFIKVLVVSSLLIPPATAQNPVLRDIEVRSFLGEPLNLRVALAASTAPDTGATCQSIIDSDQRENALRGKDLILTMVELRDSRYLHIRGHQPFNEPVARFSIRIGCPGEPAFDREFTVLLDPPPFIAPPVEPVAADSRTRPIAPSTSTTRAKSAKPRASTATPSPRAAAAVAVPAAPAGNASAAANATFSAAVATTKVATKPAARTETAGRGEGFTLRLSGSEMDLSRSRNMSDEQRRRLREKQLMLDADDQVAALLSLTNTVKQMEQRLNEIQLKQTAELPIRSTAPATTPPASSTVTPVATAAPAVPATTPAASPPEKSARPKASLADTITGYLTSPLALGGIVVALLALLASRAWSRRDGKSKRIRDSVTAGAQHSGAAAPESTRGKSTGARTDDSAFAEWENEEVGGPPSTRQTPVDAYTRTVRGMPDEPTDIREADVTAGHGAARTRIDTHHQIDAPVVFDDTPANYELDSNTATAVDFLVGMDEKLPEDRVRRLQYMHERYPELKSNTVSIDDADSVITAARLYYEEGNKGNGREKASELLTFAVEERPQEIRFWLAQFEIFRLENMVAEFHELAGKFHVLFSHTPAWPKVRHVGHELDPGNPLFAASGSPLLAGETRFDPIAENWLDAPMDFTSDALMSDLRLALLDDHGVSRADFESITARFATPAGPAQ